MSRVQKIAEQLRSLSLAEIRELRILLDQYEEKIWDEQFASDVNEGKWDALADEALQDHHEGRSTPL